MTDKTSADPLAELARVAQARTKSRGSVRLALAQDLEYLRQAMRLGLTLAETAEQIEASMGLRITGAGLRKILLDLLPTEYAEYLTNTGRGYRRTRAGVTSVKPAPEKQQSNANPVLSKSPATTKRAGTPGAIREARNKAIDLDDYIE